MDDQFAPLKLAAVQTGLNLKFAGYIFLLLWQRTQLEADLHSPRRDFLRVLAAATSAAALRTGLGQQMGTQAKQAAPAFNLSAFEFWTHQALEPPSGTLSGTSNAIPPGEARKPKFIIHTTDGGFRFPSRPPVQVEELGKFDKANAKLRVVAFKPSDHDRAEIDSSHSATLRFDLLQQGMLPSETAPSEPKGSTAILGKTVNDQNKKLDPANLLTGLSVGDAQEIALPGGGGWLRLAFFFQKKDAIWHQVLSTCLKLS